MNLSVLIKQYFSSVSNDITIDVFDEKNIYDVYQRVVGTRLHCWQRMPDWFLRFVPVNMRCKYWMGSKK